MTKENFISQINHYTSQGIPYLFLIDFELESFFLCKLDACASRGVFYEVKGQTNFLQNHKKLNRKVNILQKEPISQEAYQRAFHYVRNNIRQGNSFLTNLTFPTSLELSVNLKETFLASKAKYKLWFRDRFVLFSPECFIRIKHGHIYSYPMKGTIDASIPNAAELILNNDKESWEHNTIVDLIRNDLSMISSQVKVLRFRYLDHLKTNHKDLLQVSSEIRGSLPYNWQKKIGEMLLNILPAGSISGAPKDKTIEIIKAAEEGKRGWYTGVFGIFDGKDLDSAVNIRYIEQNEKGLQFRSGGGITAYSEANAEYKELLDKVYVPAI